MDKLIGIKTLLVFSLGSLGDALPLYVIAMNLAHSIGRSKCSISTVERPCHSCWKGKVDTDNISCKFDNSDDTSASTNHSGWDEAISVHMLADTNVCERLQKICGAHTCVQLHKIPQASQSLLLGEAFPSLDNQRKLEQSAILNFTNSFLPKDYRLPAAKKNGDANILPLYFMFNLFSIEAWSIAEVLSRPSICATPFNPSVVTPMPRQFYTDIQTCDSDFGRQLSGQLFPSPSNLSIGPPIPINGARHSNTLPLTLTDLEFWMWRLLMDDQDEFRSILGTDAHPFTKTQSTSIHPCGIFPATRLLLLQDDALLADLPTASSITRTGFVIPPTPHSPILNKCDFAADIQNWRIANPSNHTLLISFGSMEFHSTDFKNKVTVTNLMLTIAYALYLQEATAIWVCSRNDSTIAIAYHQLTVSKPWTLRFIHLHVGMVSVGWLADLCKGIHVEDSGHYKYMAGDAATIESNNQVAALHHGGVGTFQTCVSSGIKQLIMPQGFDQHDICSRGEELGISRCVKVDMGVEDWQDAIEWAMHDPSLSTVEFHQLIMRENRKRGEGTIMAVKMISEWMSDM
ncbi:hypothetical protein BASA61_000185 [Batrachochytrium salamandrivorans]|nr:hypothetical protein BASA62_000060 [Batrachochytrium salamandrivorans]KAH6573060.1 hypothetical protein BASA60_006228 [Batrachochytrium salamandrivorans]KAH6578428.1 hypothetical protein BASA61_000185 [Batrachochytrium salamandrivorans]KAH9268596.1 hypothetical protein BASA84_000203 [Batrachochytrium salamandrivorans]